MPVKAIEVNGDLIQAGSQYFNAVTKKTVTVTSLNQIAPTFRLSDGWYVSVRGQPHTIYKQKGPDKEEMSEEEKNSKSV